MKAGKIVKVEAYTDGFGGLHHSEWEAEAASERIQAQKNLDRIVELVERHIGEVNRKIYGDTYAPAGAPGASPSYVARLISHAIENKTELAQEIVRQLEEQG